MMRQVRAFVHLIIVIAFFLGFLYWGLIVGYTAMVPDEIRTLEDDPLRLTTISGAGYHDQTKELIVVGDNDVTWAGITRAYINENLLLTLRTAYDNPIEWPGVTIEFAPVPGQPPVPNGTLPVYYFGKTDNTRHGQVTFEADRLLKAYSLGKDNITNLDVISSVSCYTSVLDKLVELQEIDYQPGPVDPQRFFFEPEMELDITPDGTAVTFTQSKMILKWAYIPEDSTNTTQNATDAAQYFVDCFNDNYDAFAAEQSTQGNNALYKLRVLGEIAAITKWIQDYDLDAREGKLEGIHFPWLDTYASLAVTATNTFTYTPAITVSASFTNDDSVITQSLYGGVDLGADNIYNVNDAADTAVNDALAARISTETEWEVPPCFIVNAHAELRVPVDCSRIAIASKLSNQFVDRGVFDEPGAWVEEDNVFPIVDQANEIAILAGYNNSVGILKQSIIIPLPQTIQPSHLILLSFDWAIGPVDPNPAPVDYLNVRIRDGNGNLIETVQIINNLAEVDEGIWQTSSIDITNLFDASSYRAFQNKQMNGTSTILEDETIELSFETQTNSTDVTTFYLDNVFIDSNLFPPEPLEPPATPTATATSTQTATPTSTSTPVPPTYHWNIYLPAIVVSEMSISHHIPRYSLSFEPSNAELGSKIQFNEE